MIERKLKSEVRYSLMCRQNVEEAKTVIEYIDKFSSVLLCLIKNIEPFDIAKFKRLLKDYLPQIKRV